MSARAVKRFVSKTVLVLFILMMAVLPLPMVPFMAVLLRQPVRRNQPAEVLKKKEDAP